MEAIHHLATAVEILPVNAELAAQCGGTRVEYAIPEGVDMKLSRKDGKSDVAVPQHQPGFAKDVLVEDESGYIFDGQNPLDVTSVAIQLSAIGPIVRFMGPEATLQVPADLARDYQLDFVAS